MALLSIADKLELHELAGRYGDAIDDRAWERLDHIFTEDAVFGLFPEANTLADDKSSVVYHGSYYDTVVKTAAGWRIRHRIYVRGRLND